MNKVCFVIAAHEKPSILRKLLLLLNNRPTIIHIDKSINWVSYANELGHLQANHILIPRDRSISVNWAGYSQVEVQLLLAKESRNFFPNCKYTVFLNGTSFPVKPLIEFEKFVIEHGDRCGISIQSLNSVAVVSNKTKNKYVGISKIKWRFYRDSISLGLLKKFSHFRKLRNGLIKTMEKFPIRNRQFDVGNTYYFGSAAFFLTSEFIDYIVTKQREIRHHFENSFAPDEMAIHSFYAWSSFFNPIEDRYFFANDLTHKALRQTPFLFIPVDFNVELGVNNLEEIKNSAKYFIKKPNTELVDAILKQLNGESN